MLYFYLILSAALLPILNNFFDIFRQSYSWWAVPLMFVGFFVGFIILHILMLVLAFVPVSLKSDREKGAKFYRFIVNISLPMVITLARVKINVTGMSPDDIPKDKRMLFICNHQFDFDPVILMSVFNKVEIGYIGKKDIIKELNLIAKAMHKLYGLFIDRENDREAAKTIIEAIRIIKNDKASIGVFPEGYASASCEMLPFRNGVFKIALKTNAPIVVCAINNTRQIPKNMFRRKTEIDFKIADVVYPEQYEGMNTVELGAMLYEKMEKAYNEIRKPQD